MRDDYPSEPRDLEQFFGTAINNITEARGIVVGQLFTEAFKVLSSESAECRQWPSLSILVPVVLNYALLGPDMASSAALRGFYTHLLASAMTPRSAETVHPSFAHLLPQMSEQDAQIAKMTVLEGRDIWPALEVRQPNPTGERYRVTGHVYGVAGCGDVSCEIVGVSVANLVRLGIFEEEWTATLSAEGVYQHTEAVAHVECMPDEDLHYTMHRGVLSLTTFGSRFVSVCVRGPEH